MTWVFPLKMLLRLRMLGSQSLMSAFNIHLFQSARVHISSNEMIFKSARLPSWTDLLFNHGQEHERCEIDTQNHRRSARRMVILRSPNGRLIVAFLTLLCTIKSYWWSSACQRFTIQQHRVVWASRISAVLNMTTFKYTADNEAIWKKSINHPPVITNFIGGINFNHSTRL